MFLRLKRDSRAAWSVRLGVALALALATGFAAGGAGSHPTTPSPDTSDPLTRESANPILRNESSFDDLKIGPSTVVKAGPSDYRQWYEAIDAQNSPGGPDFLTQVAYATSADGSSWTKRGVVFAPLPAPSWERSEVSPTSMHRDGSNWILFYHGGNNTGPRAIGRATSPTGSGDFTRSPATPILERGSPGSWDSEWVADAKVIAPWEGPDDLWRMYYVGRSGGGNGQVGLATSKDGISFTKYAKNPIVGLGPAGAWDDGNIQAFSPEWDAGVELFRAWYVARRAGAGSAGGNAGYLWSSDGVSWTRDPNNPVLVSVAGDRVEDSIDSYRDGDRYRFVYGQYNLDASPPLRGKGAAWTAAAAPPGPTPPPPPPPTTPPPTTPPPTTPPPTTPETTTAAFAVAQSGDDGDLERGDAAYPPSGAAETDGSRSGSVLYVRRSKATPSYQPVRVALLRFDTSALPDDATLTYAELQLHTTVRSNTDGRALLAEWYPVSGWPIDGNDWTIADTGSAHGGTPLAAFQPGAQQALELHGLSSIDRRGPTAVRLHVSGSTSAPLGPNDLAFAAYDHATLPAPTLVVTYRTGG